MAELGVEPSDSSPTMHYCMGGTGGYDGIFEGENILVSAGVAYRNPGADMFSIHIPDDPNHLIVDSGGYQAAVWWNGVQASERGLHGWYPYSATELHTWGEEIGADVVAGRDVACEEAVELFDHGQGHRWPESYRKRWRHSLDYQIRQQQVFEQGDFSHDWMPVIQGKEPHEYERFIELMTHEGLHQYDKLAIGTVCKRSHLDEILDVVLTVRDHFPDKWLHLFGATLTVYKDPRFDGLFDSSDTAAWHWGAGSKEEAKELFVEYRSKIERHTQPGTEQIRLQPSHEDGGQVEG